MVLADTSAWVEIFRKGSAARLDSSVDFDDIVTCLPVIQEVLQGFRDETAFFRAREAMRSLPIVDSPMPEDVFLHGADLYRAGRRAGVTIRSGVDCIIAACAIRHHLEILHHARDYDAIARISPLRVRRLKLR